MAQKKVEISKKVEKQETELVNDPKVTEAIVNVLKDEGIGIKLEKLSNTKFLADQGRFLAGSPGCISNPGGPSC